MSAASTTFPPATTTSDHATPKWMRYVLLAAGVYNLVWGAWGIVAPLAIFRLSGVEPLPAYPELWQCVAMIVGVYGVGYVIAATNPIRHWPIVLVGLLGKIFGPLGFLNAYLAGRFPLSMGWTLVTNDLIWWLPFAAILWHAWTHRNGDQFAGQTITSATGE